MRTKYARLGFRLDPIMGARLTARPVTARQSSDLRRPGPEEAGILSILAFGHVYTSESGAQLPR